MSASDSNRRRSNRSSSDEATVFSGELVATQQPITPPETPKYKRRRRLQGISEESGEELLRFLGDIRSEDFRTGGPTLCRLPTVSVSLFSGAVHDMWESNQGSWKRSVRKILNRWNVDTYELYLVWRKFRYDQVDEAVFAAGTETIFVVTEQRHLSNDWLRAAVEIRHACAAHNLPFINVEIADPRGLESLESVRV